MSELDAALAAARKAGEVAWTVFREGFTVEIKADQSPVTRADRQAEEAAREILRRAFPDYGFLGEEFGAEGDGNARWIIDPLDGTKNFVRGLPWFAALVALEKDGEVTVGVCHAPAADETLWAARGRGAFFNGRPVRVSGEDQLSRAQLLHGGLQYFRRQGRWEQLGGLIDASARQRGFGDYLGHALVCRGLAEAMLDPTVAPWDVAPFKVIAAEAGGRFTDFSGDGKIDGGSALVSNGRVHDDILRILSGPAVGPGRKEEKE